MMQRHVCDRSSGNKTSAAVSKGQKSMITKAPLPETSSTGSYI